MAADKLTLQPPKTAMDSLQTPLTTSTREGGANKSDSAEIEPGIADKRLPLFNKWQKASIQIVQKTAILVRQGLAALDQDLMVLKQKHKCLCTWIWEQRGMRGAT